MYVCAYVHVCVCSIWRDVKLPTVFFAGVMRQSCKRSEAMHDGGSRGWSPWCTYFFRSILFTMFDFWKWHPAKPRTGTTTLSHGFLLCNLVRFSQSDVCTSLISEPSFRTEHEYDEQQWLFFHPSWTASGYNTAPLTSDLLLVLLHDRYTPHQNPLW